MLVKIPFDEHILYTSGCVVPCPVATPQYFNTSFLTCRTIVSMFSLFDFAHVHEMQTVVLIIDSLGVEFGWVGLLRRNKQAVVDNVLETTMFRFLPSVDTSKP